MAILAEYLEMLRRIGDELIELRYHAALLDLQLALRAYDPSQPRVPAGNPDGGQWTGGGGSGDLAARILDIADQAGKFPPPPPGYDSNTWKEGKFGNGKA